MEQRYGWRWNGRWGVGDCIHHPLGYVLVKDQVYPRCEECLKAFDPETGIIVEEPVKKKPRKPC